jgi:hypothetical protein
MDELLAQLRFGRQPKGSLNLPWYQYSTGNPNFWTEVTDAGNNEKIIGFRLDDAFRVKMFEKYFGISLFTVDSSVNDQNAKTYAVAVTGANQATVIGTKGSNKYIENTYKTRVLGESGIEVDKQRSIFLVNAHNFNITRDGRLQLEGAGQFEYFLSGDQYYAYHVELPFKATSTVTFGPEFSVVNNQAERTLTIETFDAKGLPVARTVQIGVEDTLLQGGGNFKYQSPDGKLNIKVSFGVQKGQDFRNNQSGPIPMAAILDQNVPIHSQDPFTSSVGLYTNSKANVDLGHGVGLGAQGGFDPNGHFEGANIRFLTDGGVSTELLASQTGDVKTVGVSLSNVPIKSLGFDVNVGHRMHFIPGSDIVQSPFLQVRLLDYKNRFGETPQGPLLTAVQKDEQPPIMLVPVSGKQDARFQVPGEIKSQPITVGVEAVKARDVRATKNTYFMPVRFPVDPVTLGVKAGISLKTLEEANAQLDKTKYAQLDAANSSITVTLPGKDKPVVVKLSERILKRVSILRRGTTLIPYVIDEETKELSLLRLQTYRVVGLKGLKEALSNEEVGLLDPVEGNAIRGIDYALIGQLDTTGVFPEDAGSDVGDDLPISKLKNAREKARELQSFSESDLKAMGIFVTEVKGKKVYTFEDKNGVAHNDLSARTLIVPQIDLAEKKFNGFYILELGKKAREKMRLDADKPVINFSVNADESSEYWQKGSQDVSPEALKELILGRAPPGMNVNWRVSFIKIPKADGTPGFEMDESGAPKLRPVIIEIDPATQRFVKEVGDLNLNRQGQEVYEKLKKDYYATEVVNPQDNPRDKDHPHVIYHLTGEKFISKNDVVQVQVTNAAGNPVTDPQTGLLRSRTFRVKTDTTGKKTLQQINFLDAAEKDRMELLSANKNIFVHFFNDKENKYAPQAYTLEEFQKANLLVERVYAPLWSVVEDPTTGEIVSAVEKPYVKDVVTDLATGLKGVAEYATPDPDFSVSVLSDGTDSIVLQVEKDQKILRKQYNKNTGIEEATIYPSPRTVQGRQTKGILVVNGPAGDPVKQIYYYDGDFKKINDLPAKGFIVEKNVPEAWKKLFPQEDARKAVETYEKDASGRDKLTKIEIYNKLGSLIATITPDPADEDGSLNKWLINIPQYASASDKYLEKASSGKSYEFNRQTGLLGELVFESERVSLGRYFNFRSNKQVSEHLKGQDVRLFAVTDLRRHKQSLHFYNDSRGKDPIATVDYTRIKDGQLVSPVLNLVFYNEEGNETSRATYEMNTSKPLTAFELKKIAYIDPAGFTFEGKKFRKVNVYLVKEGKEVFDKSLLFTPAGDKAGTIYPKLQIISGVKVEGMII